MDNKNNVNHLSWVPKHEILNNEKLQVITSQGTRICEDNQTSINTITPKHDYPNPWKQKKKFKDESQIFQELSIQEDNNENKKSTLNELLQLLTKKDDVHRLVDIMNSLKN